MTERHPHFLNNLGKVWELKVSEPKGQQCFHIVRSSKRNPVRLLNGFWGEATVLYLIRKVMADLNKQADRSHGYEIFSNLELRLPARPEVPYMELDVVLLVDKRDLYIFESKCGQTMAIDKWVDRTRLFEEPPAHTLAPDNHPTYSDLKGHFITCTPRDDIKPCYFLPYKMIHFSTMEEDLKKILQDS